jgi:prevent-host-death family protein
MKEVSTVNFRENLSEYVNQAAYGHEHIMLTRRGKKVAVFLSYKEYKKLTDK